MSSDLKTSRKFTPYLSTVGAWALAFGCSVGWGAFVMPGTTFLPIAGPIGTALGLGLGAAVMLVLARVYHYLVSRHTDSGGTYAYTKETFGYDEGFLSAWFLILTYIAIIWANATALPLIARTLLGSLFQFGFDYYIAGYHVYLGEILLAVGSLLIAALLCLNRKTAQAVQIVMAFLLLGGIVICFAAALGTAQKIQLFTPAYAPAHAPLSSIFTIFTLAPWAYVGFESISHSSEEASYSPKHTFTILSVALITAGAAYILLSLLATTALPEGCASWVDYVANLDRYSGLAAQPAFFASEQALGPIGAAALGVSALCAIFTGLIGNYIALSRLLHAMAEDSLLPKWCGTLDKNSVPRNAILLILVISILLPFLGRTAISWIVDVTTVGATIAYAFASWSAYRFAKQENNARMRWTSAIGLLISVLFGLAFMVPNIISVKTLSTESYLILALWAILGFLVFRYLLQHDTEHHLGRSTIAWIVLLGLIIFTSSVWLRQTTSQTINHSLEALEPHFAETSDFSIVESLLASTERALSTAVFVQAGLIVAALGILFRIYSIIQKREKQAEVEKALAEESSRAKTSFLSNMSHEIRTPMNAIIGLDNIALRDPDLPSRTRTQLEKIGTSARHLLGLINDILDMSRIESGRMVLNDEEFSFREFIEQINIIINGQCVDKGLHYECNLEGQISDYYYGDDMKLKQVLINILGNSVKFTNPPGDVTLNIKQINRDGDYCTLRFTMKDTGIGMDKEFIPKLFDAFSQEDATATNQYGGSGLGMAITRNFVEMMNGDIQVESEKGVGSTFTVTVKLRASDRRYQLSEEITLPKNLMTLIVDDDEISAEHSQFVFDAIGIHAEYVSSPYQAIQLIKNAHEAGHPYQLVVTDYKMPELNGLELTRRIREFDEGETAILLLTGYNWDIIEDEAKAEGVDGILAKPLFSDNTIKAIHSILEQKKGNVVTPVSSTVASVSSIAGRRILVAEDVDENAEILIDLLDLEDILCERAENGQIAVDRFMEKPAGYYDAILMDVRMPVMDGLTATRTIRALEREDAKQIPIIAMTANVFDEDVERSLQSGMNAHLSKPIDPDVLYQTLADFINKTSRSDT
ncbi:MAG: amino acid permease [Solobacterium sp.]|nr:amino acid permease [Solobacterium sp.]